MTDYSIRCYTWFYRLFQLQFTRSINKHDLNVSSVSVKYARFGILSGRDFLGNTFGLNVRLPLHLYTFKSNTSTFVNGSCWKSCWKQVHLFKPSLCYEQVGARLQIKCCAAWIQMGNLSFTKRDDARRFTFSTRLKKQCSNDVFTTVIQPVWHDLSRLRNLLVYFVSRKVVWESFVYSNFGNYYSKLQFWKLIQEMMHSHTICRYFAMILAMLTCAWINFFKFVFSLQLLKSTDDWR